MSLSQLDTLLITLLLTVELGPEHQCHAYEPVILHASTGYISNVVAENTGYGAAFCPWKIVVGKGQKINLTLHDFGVLQYNKDSPICQVIFTTDTLTIQLYLFCSAKAQEKCSHKSSKLLVLGRIF